MKTAHSTKIPSTAPVGAVKVVAKGSLLSRMLETKKAVKAYLNGELTLSDLESKGIELV
ncbi:hypothetical protein MUK70_12755 [Dyadobacter chenwenxiniae]|uniref:Uncharacterized protein n=1 Tax=Dyadobacter chenwenxiniae TaxID=2906456 RepID=A0A9X1PG62_9BACT|nr:hypothetical protein [Dyadobacter chenwenxiniae]MCF0060113.1 hypothetical protein [Dyadobacter chenwenxiniae]UON85851.1 hypothetical protein MUK70_12755 [Dyadobacter chenwenxiniae]